MYRCSCALTSGLPAATRRGAPVHPPSARPKSTMPAPVSAAQVKHEVALEDLFADVHAGKSA